MLVGRRRVLLPFAFLGLIASLTSSSGARAQQDGTSPHKIWTKNLTADQIKTRLDRLALGGDDKHDPLHKLIREQLGKKFPNVPQKSLDEFIERALSDPKFMDMARQMAKEKQTDPGRVPKWNRDDINKMLQAMPGRGDPKKSAANPTQPVEPRTNFNPGPPFDPKRSPGPQKSSDNSGQSGPGNPPMRDPGRPGEPPAGQSPTVPPSGANPASQAAGPSSPPSVNDELFRPPDEPTDPREKSMKAFAAVWERNVGPLDQTPEVKKALFDLTGSAAGLDFDLKDDKGNSIWDLLRKGEGGSFGDLMEGSGSWHLPQMDFPKMNFGKWATGSSGKSSSSSSWWGSRDSSHSRSGSSGGTGGPGSFSFGGSWFPVVILGIVVLGILLWIVIKRLHEETPRSIVTDNGLGPWPIDPRRINTREDVVKAFEYLSVLICGESARTWTHNTIADALSELAATHGDTAVMLARLYELARYAPLDEPLTRDELIEARELVCGLAGVSY